MFGLFGLGNVMGLHRYTAIYRYQTDEAAVSVAEEISKRIAETQPQEYKLFCNRVGKQVFVTFYSDSFYSERFARTAIRNGSGRFRVRGWDDVQNLTIIFPTAAEDPDVAAVLLPPSDAKILAKLKVLCKRGLGEIASDPNGLTVDYTGPTIFNPYTSTGKTTPSFKFSFREEDEYEIRDIRVAINFDSRFDYLKGK